MRVACDPSAVSRKVADGLVSLSDGRSVLDLERARPSQRSRSGQTRDLSESQCRGQGVSQTVSYYVNIKARHRPFSLPGLDEARRVVYSANFEARALAPVDKWSEEVAEILKEDLGPGSGSLIEGVGTDTFIGRAVAIPDSSPVVQIIDTGGKQSSPLGDGEFERPTVQVLVRDVDDLAAETLILAIWRRLGSVRNKTVVAA